MDYETLRSRMISRLESLGVTDAAVLEAMRAVPRHLFVPENIRSAAYENRPLPIGGNQTISEPFMVGVMTQLLQVRPSDTVLEIGTGSGYQAAVLAELASEVYTIECNPALAEPARRLLIQLGYDNIHVVVGDGTVGFPDAAPYHRIIVTAAAPNVPPPLIDQLAVPGRMVLPLGDRQLQELTVVSKTHEGLDSAAVFDCRFVPLVGEYGWEDY